MPCASAAMDRYMPLLIASMAAIDFRDDQRSPMQTCAASAFSKAERSAFLPLSTSVNSSTICQHSTGHGFPSQWAKGPTSARLSDRLIRKCKGQCKTV